MCDFVCGMMSHAKLSLHWSVIPIALRKAKIVYNFGLSECKRDN